MSVRMSFHVFIESKDLKLIRRVIKAFEFDPEDSAITVAVGNELPGCWLTLTDGTLGVNFWGMLAENVPRGMARWWEVSDAEFSDSAFVNAYNPDGTEHWSANFDEGLARMQEELRSNRLVLPDESGELQGAEVINLGEDWMDELADLLGAVKGKKRTRKPKQDPHLPWHNRDDEMMLSGPETLVAAAPADLDTVLQRLDYAEALWRCSRKEDARKRLADLRPSSESELRQVLDAAAPKIWTRERERYLPDFSLELLAALPENMKHGRYWLHLAQALSQLDPDALLPLLQKLFSEGLLVGDIELREALEAMPAGPQQQKALELFRAAERAA